MSLMFPAYLLALMLPILLGSCTGVKSSAHASADTGILNQPPQLVLDVSQGDKSAHRDSSNPGGSGDTRFSEGELVQFDLSESSGGTAPYVYQIDFGDGHGPQTSSTPTFSHVFSHGVVPVTLQIEDAIKNSASLSLMFLINCDQTTPPLVVDASQLRITHDSSDNNLFHVDPTKAVDGGLGPYSIVSLNITGDLISDTKSFLPLSNDIPLYTPFGDVRLITMQVVDNCAQEASGSTNYDFGGVYGSSVGIQVTDAIAGHNQGMELPGYRFVSGIVVTPDIDESFQGSVMFSVGHATANPPIGPDVRLTASFDQESSQVSFYGTLTYQNSEFYENSGPNQYMLTLGFPIPKITQEGPPVPVTAQANLLTFQSAGAGDHVANKSFYLDTTQRCPVNAVVIQSPPSRGSCAREECSDNGKEIDIVQLTLDGTYSDQNGACHLLARGLSGEPPERMQISNGAFHLELGSAQLQANCTPPPVVCGSGCASKEGVQCDLGADRNGQCGEPCSTGCQTITPKPCPPAPPPPPAPSPPPPPPPPPPPGYGPPPS